MTNTAAPPGRRGMMDRLFRSAMFLVPLGVAANLWWTWYATDHRVFAEIGELPRQYLFLAFVLGLVPWITNATRMWLWCRFMGLSLTWRDNLGVSLGAELASSVVPTSSGNEVMRWGIFVQKGVPQGKAISIVTLGWLEDSLFFITAIPTAIVVSQAWELPVLRAIGRQARGKVVAIVVVAVAAIVALRLLWGAILAGGLGRGLRRRALRWRARARQRLARTVAEVREVRRLVVARGKSLFLLTWLITAVQWCCRYSVVTALAYFLAPDARVDPVLFFLLQWVVFTALNFVPTPGAQGGAEAAFVLVYSALLPAAVIGIATSGWRFLTFYVQLALGSVIFTWLNLSDARRAALRRREDAAATAMQSS